MMSHTRTNKTCKPCRLRKVKCDGQSGCCGQCHRSRKVSPIDCIYDEISLSKSVPRLQKGEACAPCSRKKKRCNGIRPYCGTCSSAGKEHECVYPEIPKPSTSKRESRRHRFARPKEPQITYADTSLYCTDVLSSSPEIVLFSCSPTVDTYEALYRAPLPSFNYDSDQSSSPYLMPPTDSIADFPRTGWSSAVSNVSPGDLNMNFRLIFLTHRLQFGFRFTALKEKAILLGDLSNKYIDSFFIHFAHMLGCNLHQERQGRYFLLHLLDLHLQHTLGALVNMSRDDPLAFAQACFFMMIACLYNQNLNLGTRYMSLAIETVKRNDIRFVPQYLHTLAHPPMFEYSEEAHEKASFLCELMSSEIELRLITGSTGVLLLDLHRQFEQELPTVYPLLFKICPVTMRVRSTQLAMQAAALLSMYEHQQTTPIHSWFISCDKFLTAVMSHISNLLYQTNLYKRDQVEYCASLQYSSFVFLFTLAEIDEILERHPLWPECRIKCKAALVNVSQIMQDISSDDLQFLYEVMGMCWRRAALVFGDNSAAVTKLWTPTCPFNSVFSNASLFLMSQCQNKIASIHLDSDARLACEELEAQFQLGLFGTSVFATFDY